MRCLLVQGVGHRHGQEEVRLHVLVVVRLPALVAPLPLADKRVLWLEDGWMDASCCCVPEELDGDVFLFPFLNFFLFLCCILEKLEEDGWAFSVL